MDGDDRVNQKLDELKDKGYKSLQDEERHRQYKRALQEYERKINCPYG